MLKTQPRRPRGRQNVVKRRLRRIVEFKQAKHESRLMDTVMEHYDGPAGAFLSLASLLSLHEPLLGHLMKSGRFDCSRFDSILDVGSGAGQILGHLLKLTHRDASLVAFDLSHEMLKRARARLKSDRPLYVSGDMTQIPFADGTFDCVTCGWVIEHLPDPAPGLSEFARVLKPGGSLLLLATEDTVQGAFTSRTWKCRTLNRSDLRRSCESIGLEWKKEFWFTPLHKLVGAGGIVVEAVKKS